MGMGKTKIQWADEVWNPVTGCTKISAGCEHCYAERQARRLTMMGVSKYANGFKVTLHSDELDRRIIGTGKRVFVCSMGDLFHNDVPFGFIRLVIANIAEQPQHTFMILTKRPERMLQYWQWQETQTGCRIFPRNVWLLVTAENQVEADRRIPILLQIPAAVHGVSIEPMLEMIDLIHYLPQYDWRPTHEWYRAAYPDCGDQPIKIKHGLDWVICGGESGLNARPINSEWILEMRDMVHAAKVPFFFKQWGDAVWPGNGNVFAGGHYHHRESHGGDYFEGQQYHEFPNTTEAGK